VLKALLLTVDGDVVRAKALHPDEVAQLHDAEDDRASAAPVGPAPSTGRAFSSEASPAALVPRAVALLQDAMAASRRSLRDVAAAWDVSHSHVHRVARGERPFTVSQLLSLLRRDPDFGLELMRRLGLEVDERRRRALARALDGAAEDVWAGIGHGV
jgi:ribosomal protein L13E